MSFLLSNIHKTLKANKLNFILRNYSCINSSAIDTFKSIVGQNNLTVSDSVRQHHSKDESLHELATSIIYLIKILFGKVF